MTCDNAYWAASGRKECEDNRRFEIWVDMMSGPTRTDKVDRITLPDTQDAAADAKSTAPTRDDLLNEAVREFALTRRDKQTKPWAVDKFQETEKAALNELSDKDLNDMFKIGQALKSGSFDDILEVAKSRPPQELSKLESYIAFELACLNLSDKYRVTLGVINSKGFVTVEDLSHPDDTKSIRDYFSDGTMNTPETRAREHPPRPEKGI